MASDRYLIHHPTGPDIKLEGEVLGEEQRADAGNAKDYRAGSGSSSQSSE